MPSGDVNHSTRLLEASTAEAYGIPFDETWYNLPVIAREQMIASRLANKWIEMLNMEKAIQQHGS